MRQNMKCGKQHGRGGGRRIGIGILAFLLTLIGSVTALSALINRGSPGLEITEKAGTLIAAGSMILGCAAASSTAHNRILLTSGLTCLIEILLLTIGALLLTGTASIRVPVLLLGIGGAVISALIFAAKKKHSF